MLHGKKVGVVIPGAGRGTRMSGSPPKQFMECEGKPIIVHTLQHFQLSPVVDCLAVAVDRGSLDIMKRHIISFSLSKACNVVVGGDVRQDSVWNGLQALEKENLDVVIIHDAVRPFINQDLIHTITCAALEHDAAVAAVPPKDTIKLSDGSRFVVGTPPRDQIWIVQTPQAFIYRRLYDAYEKAMSDQYYGTDDATLVERLGTRVKIVEGSYDNIKITTLGDFELAQLIAKRVWATT